MTVACYTMWFVGHCPSREHWSFFLQLHSFTGYAADVDVQWEKTAAVLLCNAMMDRNS